MKFVLTIDEQPLTLKLEAILSLFGKSRTIEFAEGKWTPFVLFELEEPPNSVPAIHHVELTDLSESGIRNALRSLPEDVSDFAGYVRREIEKLDKPQAVRNEKSENDTPAFVSQGEQWKASALNALIIAQRPGETPLGELSLVDQRWLETALTHLIQIDQSRRVGNVCDNAYCIFNAGLAYFQCLAPPFSSSLRCEAVSEKCVPEMAAILTPEKRNRLLQEFGFSSSTKNFEQRIEINGDEDLAYVARMAFQVLKDIYEVDDFSAAGFKLSIPAPALPVALAFALPPTPPAELVAEKAYVVLVDDNFHYQNEEERYREGDYATLKEAVIKCMSIVDDSSSMHTSRECRRKNFTGTTAVLEKIRLYAGLMPAFPPGLTQSGAVMRFVAIGAVMHDCGQVRQARYSCAGLCPRPH